MQNVMSKKIYIDGKNLLKSFLLSLSLHAAILAVVVYSSVSKPIPLKAEEKTIMISLQDYVPAEVKKKTLKKASVEKPKRALKKIKQKPMPKETKKVQNVTEAKKFQKSPSVTNPVAESSEAFTPQQVHTDPVAKETVIKADSSNRHSPSMTKDLPAQKTQLQNIGKEELALIRLMIENSLSYPAIAKKLKIEGVVVVSFSLKTDGYLQNLQIVSSSGSSALDNKALQTVSSLDGEYPHLEKKVDLKLPIAFSLNKS